MQEFEHSLALPFFGTGIKTASPVATAEFSIFVGILSMSILVLHKQMIKQTKVQPYNGILLGNTKERTIGNGIQGHYAE